MQAVRITSPNHLEYVHLPPPEPAPSEVLIRVMASGICGTDIHILRGEYLGPYPVIPGHEFSGVVEQVGSGVTRFKTGDRVAVEPNIACDNCQNCLNNRQNFCLNWQAVGVSRPGGMAQWVCVPEKSAFHIQNLPFEQGAWMEPLSCVLHGMERLQLDLASNVLVLGAGPIGSLLVQVARLQSASRISVVDKNRSRAQSALESGADACFYTLDELPLDAYDAVIDATGALPVLKRSLAFVRHGGKILWFGVPPAGQEVSLEPFVVFRKGLTVLSSFTSVRNSYQALDLLSSGRVDTSRLVSHQLSLQEFQHGVEMIEQGQENVLKVLIRPNG